MRKGKKVRMFPMALMALTVLSGIPVLAAETDMTEKEPVRNDGLIVDSGGSSGESPLLSFGELSLTEDQTGSIRITLTDGAEGTSKEGVELNCLKVADVENGVYVLDSAYEDLGVDLNAIANAAALESAAGKIAEAADITAAFQQTTDASGQAVFEDLEIGVYLIQALEDAEYDDVTPFLAAIPTWDEESGNMAYDLEIEPKHSPKPEEPETPKDAPQTNVNSPVMWYFAGVGVIGVILFVVNTRWKKKNYEDN